MSPIKTTLIQVQPKNSPPPPFTKVFWTYDLNKLIFSYVDVVTSSRCRCVNRVCGNAIKALFAERWVQVQGEHGSYARQVLWDLSTLHQFKSQTETAALVALQITPDDIRNSYLYNQLTAERQTVFAAACNTRAGLLPIPIYRRFIAFGANVQQTSVPTRGAVYSSLAPLHYAAMQLNYDLCCLLLDEGANSAVQDKEGKTPLDYAHAAAKEAQITPQKKDRADQIIQRLKQAKPAGCCTVM